MSTVAMVNGGGASEAIKLLDRFGNSISVKSSYDVLRFSFCSGTYGIVRLYCRKQNRFESKYHKASKRSLESGIEY